MEDTSEDVINDVVNEAESTDLAETEAEAYRLDQNVDGRLRSLEAELEGMRRRHRSFLREDKGGAIGSATSSSDMCVGDDGLESKVQKDDKVDHTELVAGLLAAMPDRPRTSGLKPSRRKDNLNSSNRIGIKPSAEPNSNQADSGSGLDENLHQVETGYSTPSRNVQHSPPRSQTSFDQEGRWAVPAAEETSLAQLDADSEHVTNGSQHHRSHDAVVGSPEREYTHGSLHKLQEAPGRPQGMQHDPLSLSPRWEPDAIPQSSNHNLEHSPPREARRDANVFDTQDRDSRGDQSDRELRNRNARDVRERDTEDGDPHERARDVHHRDPYGPDAIPGPSSRDLQHTPPNDKNESIPWPAPQEVQQFPSIPRDQWSPDAVPIQGGRDLQHTPPRQRRPDHLGESTTGRHLGNEPYGPDAIPRPGTRDLQHTPPRERPKVRPGSDDVPAARAQHEPRPGVEDVSDAHARSFSPEPYIDQPAFKGPHASYSPPSDKAHSTVNGRQDDAEGAEGWAIQRLRQIQAQRQKVDVPDSPKGQSGDSPSPRMAQSTLREREYLTQQRAQEQELQFLRERCADQSAQLEAMRRQMESLQSNRSKGEKETQLSNNSLNLQVQEASSELAQSNARVRCLEGEVDSIQQSNRTLSVARKQLMQQLEIEEETRREVEHQLQSLRAETDGMQGRYHQSALGLRQAQNENESLQKQLQQMHAKIEESLELQSSHRAEIHASKRSLRQEEQWSAQLKEENERLLADLQRVEANVQNLQSENLNLRTSLANSQQETREQIAFNDEQERALRQLGETLLMTKRENLSLRKDLGQQPPQGQEQPQPQGQELPPWPQGIAGHTPYNEKFPADMGASWRRPLERPVRSQAAGPHIDDPFVDDGSPWRKPLDRQQPPPFDRQQPPPFDRQQPLDRQQPPRAGSPPPFERPQNVGVGPRAGSPAPQSAFERPQGAGVRPRAGSPVAGPRVGSPVPQSAFERPQGGGAGPRAASPVAFERPQNVVVGARAPSPSAFERTPGAEPVFQSHLSQHPNSVRRVQQVPANLGSAEPYVDYSEASPSPKGQHRGKGVNGVAMALRQGKGGAVEADREQRQIDSLEKQLMVLNSERQTLENTLMKFPTNSAGKTASIRRQKQEVERRLNEVESTISQVKQSLRKLEVRW